MDPGPECVQKEEAGVEETKVCIRCDHIKSILVFEKKKRELNHRNICRSCRTGAQRITQRLRREHIKRHGPPSEDCSICGKSDIVFDHCHSTNQFRGWICRSCNSGIGKMGDTYRDVQDRADYLKEFEATQVLAFMKDINVFI